MEPAVDRIKNIDGERNSHNDAFVQDVATQNLKPAIKEIREKSSIYNEIEKIVAILETPQREKAKSIVFNQRISRTTF